MPTLRDAISQTFVGSEAQLSVIRQAANDWVWLKEEIVDMSAEDLADYWVDCTKTEGCFNEVGEFEDAHPEALEILRIELIKSAERAGVKRAA